MAKRKTNAISRSNTHDENSKEPIIQQTIVNSSPLDPASSTVSNVILRLPVYDALFPILDNALPEFESDISSLKRRIEKKPTVKRLQKVYLSVATLLSASISRQQEAEKRLSITRAYSDCSDLVNERLTYYRKGWANKFQNKPIPQIVKLWGEHGGPGNRNSQYSEELFDVIKKRDKNLKNEQEVWNRFEVVSGWILYYAERCSHSHANLETKKKKPVEVLTLILDVIENFKRGSYGFTKSEYGTYVRTAVEELLEQRFKRDGNFWVNAFTNERLIPIKEDENGIAP